MIQQHPLSLLLFRGFDLSTDELGVPTWVLAPILRFLRQVAFESSRWLRQRYAVRIPEAFVTVHVGEDFVHLLGGLRRVDEAIQALGLHEGDRLGHASALGIQADSWAADAGEVAMSREERLLDLIWECKVYGQGRVRPSGSRMAYLRHAIAELSEEIFGSRKHPFDLIRLYDDLQDERMLRLVAFPHGAVDVQGSGMGAFPGGQARSRRPPWHDRQQLLLRYLCDHSVFRRGTETIWVSTEPEAEILRELQGSLRKKVGAIGLCVEINPTSNLLIGDLSDLGAHPMWNLDPPRPVEGASPVPVCIGSDDPLTFATDIRREYMLLRDAMVEAGLSDEEADRWLEKVRENGLYARFTVPPDCLEWNAQIRDTERLTELARILSTPPVPLPP